MVYHFEGGGCLNKVFFFLKKICGVLCFLLNYVKHLSFSFFNHIYFKTISFRYHEANGKAKARVLELIRGLATELQSHINILVFSSTLLVIAKALYAHVRFVNILVASAFIFVDKMQWHLTLCIDFLD